MMLVFWLLVAGMLALAMLLLLPVVLRGSGELLDTSEQQDLVLARERLQELEQARADGEISADEFEREKQELEDMLAADLAAQPATRHISKQGRGLIGGLLVVVPVAAILLYQYLGNPELIEVEPATVSRGMPTDHPEVGGDNQQLPSVDVMVARLAERLQQQPDDVQGWNMLARSYMSLERYPEATRAYEQLLQRGGDDPNVLVAYADALAMSRDGDMTGRPLELIEQALALEPEHPTALWLSGMAYRQQGRDAAAVAQWRKARSVLAGDPSATAKLDAMIAGAQRAMGETPAVASRDATSDSSSDPGELPPIVSAKIMVSVTLDEAFREQVEPNDTVFILARAIAGPPMPLAVVKKQVRDLPITVELNDAQAMMPAMKLSNYKEVTVVARVSKSGSPMAQSGDIEAQSAAVKPVQQPSVQLTINQPVP